MNELLIDHAMSCALANLSLIKAAVNPNASIQIAQPEQLIAAATECTQQCLVCVRSCETGSVLPETMELWCNSCQALLDLISAQSQSTSELSAAADACETCIRSCHRQPV